MMHLQLRSLILALLLGGLPLSGGLPGITAQAASPESGFVVQPEAGQPAQEIGKGYFQLQLRGGETHAARLIVKNLNDVPLALLVYPADGVQVADGGIEYGTRTAPREGPGTWLTLEPGRILLAPQEARRLVATISVPSDVATGMYVAGIAVEIEAIETSGLGSKVLIDVHQRQVIGVAITTPGVQTTGVTVHGVQLEAASDSARAVVTLENTGTGIVNGQGTVAIGGQSGSTGLVPFPVSSMLPGATVRIPVLLPVAALLPGAYEARVEVGSGSLAQPVAWQGQAKLADPRPEQVVNALRDTVLAPVQSLGFEFEPLPIAAGAMALLMLQAALLLRRRGHRLALRIHQAGANGRHA